MMILEHMKTWSVSVVAAAIMIGLAWGAGVGAAAAGDPSLRLQGVIMERDGQTLVINERPLLLTTATKVCP